MCRKGVVLPTCNAEQHRHLNKYTTPDFRSMGTLSLKEQKVEVRVQKSGTSKEAEIVKFLVTVRLGGSG